MNFKLVLLFLCLGLFVMSCGGSGTDEAEDAEGESLILLTHEQFKMEEMLFGKLEPTAFEEVVRCNGHIIPKPSGSAFVNTLLPGRVDRIFITQGEEVVKGQALFELSGNEVISLQKEYAEAAHLLKRVKTEYERLKSLSAENIGARKDLIHAEGEYKSVQAAYAGLQLKIRLLGIDAEKAEEGKFSSSFVIRSPISGYVSRLNIMTGQYADPQTALAEIVDMNQLQLQLAVFEKDMHKLSLGQEVRFTFMGNPEVTHKARLSAVGKTVDQDAKNISCFAALEVSKEAVMFSNAYVEAQIITTTDTVNAIPEEAVISSGGSHYVLCYEKEEGDQFFLKKVEVETGRSFNGDVEIVMPKELPRILTRGAYNLYIE